MECSPAEARALAAYRLVLGAGLLAMLGLSGPLWLGGGDFPRVPFVAGFPSPGGPPGWAIFGALLAAVAASAAGPRRRAATLAAVGLLGFLVLGDQNRLQPWAYQYLVVGVALAGSPPAAGLRLARLFAVALYAHSGLSKLDATFAAELGQSFLTAGLAPLGLEPAGWPTRVRTAAALAMPAFELAVAALLALPRTRRLGAVGLLVLHGSILAILGPRGLGHSAIVLIWNAALLVEGLILFGLAPPPTPIRLADLPRSVPPAGWVVVLAAVLPTLERAGLWDTWPSFAVYASHNERAEVYFHAEDAGRLPGPLRRNLRAADGPWLRLDLTGWSREARGVPLYPSGRVGTGVALGLAETYRTAHPVRVVHLGRADRLTGRREESVSVGAEALRRRTSDGLINALPARAAGADRARRWGFGTARAE